MIGVSLSPNSGADLNLFDFTGKIDSRVTCSRNSTAAYTDKNGVLKFAAVNTARRDYYNGQLRGLLRENAATNICLRSQEFSHGTWIGSGSVTANTGVAPDGTITADRHTATDQHNFAFYNVTGASFVGSNVAYTPTTSWQRVQQSVTTPAGCTSMRFYAYRNSGGTVALYQTITVSAATVYTFSFWVRLNGGGTEFWGTQVETGTVATSYIPTTTVSATRQADAISVDLTGYGMNNTGSARVVFMLNGIPTSDGKLVQLDSGADTANTRIALGVDTNGWGKIYGDTTNVGDNLLTSATEYVFMGSWDDSALYSRIGTNDVEEYADTVANSFTTMRLGAGVSGGGLNCWIKSVRLYKDCQLTKRRTQLTLPSELSWFTPKVYVDADGRGSTSLNFTKNKPSVGTAYYVDPVNGNDVNSGATMALALKNITTALGKADVGEIILAAGTYARTRIPSSTHTLARNLAISVYNRGTANILGSDQDVTWTADGTYPTVYTRVRSNVADVRDATWLDANGEWRQLTLQTSVAAVNANAGSYYVDGSNNLYVKTFDSRMPDNNLHAFLNGTFWSFQGQYTLWVDGTINLLGVQDTQVRNTGLSTYVTYWERNIKAKYKVGSNDGISVKGCDTYRFNGTASDNLNDGYDHTALNGRANRALEVNCTSVRNGGSGAGNNNASTMHDNGSIIRLNCTGSECEGPIFADVDSSTSSLMINCSAASSTDTSSPILNYELQGKAWLINCTSTDAGDYDMRVGGTVRYYGSQTFSNTVTSGSLTKVANLSDIFS